MRRSDEDGREGVIGDKAYDESGVWMTEKERKKRVEMGGRRVVMKTGK